MFRHQSSSSLPLPWLRLASPTLHIYLPNGSFFVHPWRSRFPFQRASRHTLLQEEQKKSEKTKTRSWIFVLVAGLQGINFNLCAREYDVFLYDKKRSWERNGDARKELPYTYCCTDSDNT
jgi:hypothetical protein